MKNNLSQSNSFFKYITVSEHDIDWGLYLMGSGFAQTSPNEVYPPAGHPTAYNFNWKRGRIINEFQILYISKGCGDFETIKTGTIMVNEGDVIFLFPGVWHRYRPDKRAGWTEYWISFNGEIPERLLHRNIFSPENPIVHLGYNAQLITLYRDIFDLVSEEAIGSHQLIASMTMQIMAMIREAILKKSSGGSNVDKIIADAKKIITHHINKTINMEDLADDLHISYSWFRRMFKHHTGLPPNKYHLQLRINRAKELLCNTNDSINLVSEKTGFSCAYHFMSIFKKHVGVTPTQWRNLSRGQV
jgi:AraC-like DNA-binding protein